MPERRTPKSMAWRSWTTFVVAMYLVACADADTVAPGPGPTTPAQPRVLGFVELAFDGVGTPNMSVSALAAPSLAGLEARRGERDRVRESGGDVLLDLSLPRNLDDSGDGTIQLGAASAGQFEFHGQRYIHATYTVRNAQLDGAAYDTDRSHLTFYAVSADDSFTTINETAVVRLLLADGSPADPALALEVLPTGLATLVDGHLTIEHPDVLQTLTEDEIGELDQPETVTSVFPYGFVVRNPSVNNTRGLPASPDPDQFDGVVDFAFKVPLQSDPADDPAGFVFLMLATDDADVLLTQSLEGQTTPAARSNVAQRASDLSATTTTLLPGGTVPNAPGPRTICSVRTAGPVDSPSAFLVNANWTKASFDPSPGTLIQTDATFRAVFSTAVYGIGTTAFTVRGVQSGPAFRDTIYSGNGTNTITTPQANFFPGEVVRIALTGPCPEPQVIQYRVQTGSSTGIFDPDATYGAGTDPVSVAIGDLDGDANPDLAVANASDANVSVLLNEGNGTFPATNPTYGAGGSPQSVAIGDLDGDGSLDLAVVNASDANVSVLLNNGDGTFPATNPTYAVGSSPASVAIGDLDGDGSLDLAVANGSDANASVLLNNGDGTFLATSPTYAVGGSPQSVAIGDLNGDGSLDVVVANGSDANVSAVLNNGDGTFPATNPTYAVGGNPQSVAIADLNRDGRVDLAVANGSDANVSVLLNNGDGTFPATNPTYAVGADPQSVAIADLNGDGGFDLAVANGSDANVSVLLNNGNATFPATNPTYDVGLTPTSVAISDLSGDASLDLATANSGDVNVSVLLGQP